MWRGSAWKQVCILNLLPLGVLWTPTVTYTHKCTLTIKPVASPYSRNMQKPQLCSLPTKNQSDQGLRLPISWKHSLNITAHSLPASCAARDCSVKANFFLIANCDFFFTAGIITKYHSFISHCFVTLN